MVLEIQVSTIRQVEEIKGVRYKVFIICSQYAYLHRKSKILIGKNENKEAYKVARMRYSKVNWGPAW